MQFISPLYFRDEIDLKINIIPFSHIIHGKLNFASLESRYFIQRQVHFTSCWRHVSTQTMTVLMKRLQHQIMSYFQAYFSILVQIYCFLCKSRNDNSLQFIMSYQRVPHNRRNCNFTTKLISQCMIYTGAAWKGYL